MAAPKKALARVLSQHLVPTANLRSPQWCDASIPAGLINLKKDHCSKKNSPVGPGLPQTVLLARIYSTKVEYSPSWDKEPEGKIKNTIELSFNKPEAWALALPFTDEQYVDSGTHMVPVFKGAPEWGPVLRVLSEKGASLEVSKVSCLVKAFFYILFPLSRL